MNTSRIIDESQLTSLPMFTLHLPTRGPSSPFHLGILMHLHTLVNPYFTFPNQIVHLNNGGSKTAKARKANINAKNKSTSAMF